MVLKEKATSATTAQRSKLGGDSFDAPVVITLAAAHLGHDVFAAFLAPLLPLLIAKLSIPLSAAGALASLFRAGSLLQPIFGAWADRTDPRYFVVATPLVTALCMTTLGVAPDLPSVALLLALAGVSAAAFHPATAATVTAASGRKRGSGSSLYMTGGKLGFATGPLFIVSFVTWFGLERTPLLVVPAALLSATLFLQLRNKARSRLGTTSRGGVWAAIKEERKSILLLSGLVVFRSTALVSISTFYPTYLTGLGNSLMFAGVAMTVYDSCGSGGALVGGTISDRLGRKSVLLLSQLVSGPLLYLAISSPGEATGLALIGIAGAMASLSVPVELTLFQELAPRARGTVAGIWYLLSFEGSVVATLIVGLVADRIGLGLTLRYCVFASMLCVPFTLALPRGRKPA